MFFLFLYQFKKLKFNLLINKKTTKTNKNNIFKYSLINKNIYNN